MAKKKTRRRKPAGRLDALRKATLAAWRRLVVLHRRAMLALGALAIVVAAGLLGFLIADRLDMTAPTAVVVRHQPPDTMRGPAAPATPAPSQRAAIPRPPAPPQAVAEPAWLHFAAPMPKLEPGRAMVAVVIDDMGLDRPHSMQVIDLQAPLTLSYLPYGKELRSQTALARLRGHELLVHIPMEPMGRADPGPNALKTDLDEPQIRSRLDEDLAQFDGYVGINNHMGSKFTAWRPGMEIVLKELKRRGLLYLDSRTTAQSLGAQIAGELGMPTVIRNVFLDDVLSADNVSRQLADLETIARRQGYAVAIGHPHPNTIAALAAWLPTLKEKGLQLVPLTTIVRARWQG